MTACDHSPPPAAPPPFWPEANTTSLGNSSSTTRLLPSPPPSPPPQNSGLSGARRSLPVPTWTANLYGRPSSWARDFPSAQRARTMSAAAVTLVLLNQVLRLGATIAAMMPRIASTITNSSSVYPFRRALMTPLLSGLFRMDIRILVNVYFSRQLPMVVPSVGQVVNTSGPVFRLCGAGGG